MAERRRHPRKPVRILVLQPDGSNPQLGYSKNLSRSGILIEGSSALSGGRDVVMIFEEARLFTCKVRIVRQTAEGVAYEFINPSTDFLDAVTRILSSAPE